MTAQEGISHNFSKSRLKLNQRQFIVAILLFVFIFSVILVFLEVNCASKNTDFMGITALNPTGAIICSIYMFLETPITWLATPWAYIPLYLGLTFNPGNPLRYVLVPIFFSIGLVINMLIIMYIFLFLRNRIIKT